MKYLKTQKEFQTSKELNYHLNEGLTLTESIFRLGSDSFYSLIEEVRSLYSKGFIELSEDDRVLVVELKTGKKAIYNGDSVVLDSPEKIRGGKSKFRVYHDCGRKDKDGNIIAKKIEWGDPNAEVANWDEGRRKSFLARHRCKDKKDKCTAGWWACNVHLFAKQLGLKSTNPW